MCGLARLAAALLLLTATIPAVSAYQAADVCSVTVTIAYTLPTSFELSFTIDDQSTTGSVSLQPGTFTIAINGNLCAGGIGFTGTSTSTVITGLETSPVSVSITALDTEVFAGEDQTADFAPIIISVSVSPTKIRYNETTTLLFGAIDPAPGIDPTGYSLVMSGAGTFNPAGKSCGAGTTCSIDYTAASDDAGNLPFTLTVTDGLNTDAVTGYVAIDSSGAVNFDVGNYHAPEIGTVSSSGDSKANYGTVEVVTVPVTDVDLAIPALSDTVTLTINISEVQTLLDGDQASIGCSMAHVNQTVTDTGADTKDFSVTWDPWYGDANSAEFYGETWCKFTFVITDSQSLTSQVIEFTMAAIGT